LFKLKNEAKRKLMIRIRNIVICKRRDKKKIKMMNKTLDLRKQKKNHSAYTNSSQDHSVSKTNALLQPYKVDSTKPPTHSIKTPMILAKKNQE